MSSEENKNPCKCNYNNISMEPTRKQKNKDNTRSGRNGQDLIIEDIIKTYGINTIRKLFNEKYYTQLDQFIHLLANTEPGPSETKKNLKKKFDNISKQIIFEDSKRIFNKKIVPVAKELVTYINKSSGQDELDELDQLGNKKIGGSYFDDDIETEQDYNDYYGLNVKPTIKPLNFDKLFKKL